VYKVHILQAATWVPDIRFCICKRQYDLYRK